jgi:hypothetical protein
MNQKDGTWLMSSLPIIPAKSYEDIKGRILV